MEYYHVPAEKTVILQNFSSFSKVYLLFCGFTKIFTLNKDQYQIYSLVVLIGMSLEMSALGLR